MMEKRERQRRMNWFMSVVKVKAWTTKMLTRARARIAERKKIEEEQAKQKMKVRANDARR